MKLKYIVLGGLIGASTLVKTNASDGQTISNADTISVPRFDSIPTFKVVKFEPRPISAASHKRDVIYTLDNGNKIRRAGGSRAWRNNNPGNLRYSSFSRDNGAIGECGEFAVFPDEKTGMAALHNLLLTDTYQNLTVNAAVSRYCHASPSVIARYQSQLKNITKLKSGTKLASLNAQQIDDVAMAIRTIEGWIPGKIIEIKSEKILAEFQNERQKLLAQNMARVR